MKLRYLLLIVVILVTYTVQSQVLRVIPNPDTASTGFNCWWIQPLNNKLYSLYYNQLNKYQLAEYDGNKYTLYNNPDSTGSLIFVDTFFYPGGYTNEFRFYNGVYKGNLLLAYKNQLGNKQLAMFNGSKIVLFNNPDTGTGLVTMNFADSLGICYNGCYYMKYNDANNHGQVVKFDGTKVSMLQPADSGYSFNNSVYDFKVINNKLFMFYEQINTSKNYLTQYDGTNLKIINTSDSLYYFGGEINSLNNDIYVIAYPNAYDSMGGMGRWDGIKMTILKDTLNLGWMDPKYPVSNVYNNNLYSLYQGTPYGSVSHNLGKINAYGTTPINYPDTIGGVSEYGEFKVYKNKLYFTYSYKALAVNQYMWQNQYMGVYDGKKMSVLPNPDAGRGIGIDSSNYGIGNRYFNLIEYNNELFMPYLNENNKSCVMKFDGNNSFLIKSPDSTVELIGIDQLVDTSCFIIGLNRLGSNILTRYTAGGISIFQNPDIGSIFSYPVFVGNKTYLMYVTLSGNNLKFNLATTDTGAVKKINGRVNSEKGNAVFNVQVSCTGTSIGNTVTDSTGDYSFNLSGGNYTIRPAKNNDINKANGVTALDIALTQAHILGKNLLNSPYKMIAADVNGDGKITALDIVYMKRLILGLDTTFTNIKTGEKRLWAFVDSSYKFADSTNPFPYKDSISYTGLNASKTNQTFTGIKLGDVNQDWNPALARSKNNTVANKQIESNLTIKQFNNKQLFFNRKKNALKK